MRVHPHLCPECGEPADRIIEQVIAVAGIDVQEDGSWEYDGNGCDVDWNTQTPKLVGEAGVGLQCGNGHEWPADLVNEDDEPDDEPTLTENGDEIAAAARALEPAGEEEPDDGVLIALTLLVTDPGVRAHLEKHDPGLLRQARNAMYEATGLAPLGEGGAS